MYPHSAARAFDASDGEILELACGCLPVADGLAAHLGWRGPRYGDGNGKMSTMPRYRQRIWDGESRCEWATMIDHVLHPNLIPCVSCLGLGDLQSHTVLGERNFILVPLSSTMQILDSRCRGSEECV